MKGLIGFFDILGYQNFLKNNSASESALRVLEIITDVPQRAKKFTKEALIANKHFDDAHETISHLVFSDTIVFTLAYPTDANEAWISNAQTYMAVCSMFLTVGMFEEGLPIRGVIHEGDFITKDMCLAGKAIVEAYQLCESLNFSGLVFSKLLGDRFINLRSDIPTNNDSAFNFTYLAPMNDGSEVKMLMPNFVAMFGASATKQVSKNLEEYVMEIFWAHQKDCPNSVDVKIHNTVKIMRKMLHNNQIHNKK